LLASNDEKDLTIEAMKEEINQLNNINKQLKVSCPSAAFLFALIRLYYCLVAGSRPPWSDSTIFTYLLNQEKIAHSEVRGGGSKTVLDSSGNAIDVKELLQSIVELNKRAVERDRIVYSLAQEVASLKQVRTQPSLFLPSLLFLPPACLYL
jgi:hypothetical protein